MLSEKDIRKLKEAGRTLGRECLSSYFPDDDEIVAHVNAEDIACYLVLDAERLNAESIVWEETLELLKVDIDVDFSALNEEERAKLEEELKNALVEGANEAITEHWNEQVEKFFEEYECERFAIVFGIVHVTTPHTYHPEYVVVNCSNEPLNDLANCGVKPHAWGILSTYDGWGNYGWVIFDKNDKGSWDLDIFSSMFAKNNADEIQIFDTRVGKIKESRDERERRRLELQRQIEGRTLDW